MSALALAADGASAAGSVALWLSIAALVVSIAAVIVNVSLWRRDGWRLAVTFRYFPAELDTSTGNRFRATVTNVGRMPCIVADATVRKREEGGLWRRVSDYPDLRPEVVGPELPRTLAPTETMIVFFTHPSPYGRVAYQMIRVSVTTGRRQFRSPWLADS
jgi:hypothetical protein